MQVRIEAPDSIVDLRELEEAVVEYLSFIVDTLAGAGGPRLDPAALAEATLGNLGAYLPPRGRLLLARGPDGALVGTAFVKMIGLDTAEMKRLFVRPAARGSGLGRTLVTRVLDEARALGAARIKLDTLAALGAARRLYEDLGFGYTDRYPESENPPAIWPFVVYMTRDLSA